MRKRLLSLGLIMVLCFSLTGCKSSDYKKAVELQNSGDYAGALELFKGIGDYDLSNMKELMDKFDNSKWADLSEDERMDFVEQAVSKIADILSLNEIPEVMYFEDDPSNCGYYYSGL